MNMEVNLTRLGLAIQRSGLLRGDIHKVIAPKLCRLGLAVMVFCHGKYQ